MLCALEDEEIIGLIILQENTDQSIHIARFFVHPDFRDSGVGSEMMEKASALLDEDMTHAFASVASTNPALTLYKRYGFQETHSFKPPSDEYIALERIPT